MTRRTRLTLGAVRPPNPDKLGWRQHDGHTNGRATTGPVAGDRHPTERSVARAPGLRLLATRAPIGKSEPSAGTHSAHPDRLYPRDQSDRDRRRGAAADRR